MKDLHDVLPLVTQPDTVASQRCFVELLIDVPCSITGLPTTKVFAMFPPVTLQAPTSKAEFTRLLEGWVSTLPNGTQFVTTHPQHSPLFQSLTGVSNEDHL